MANTVLHAKHSNIADDSNVELVRPSDWNHEHLFANGALFNYLMFDAGQSDSVVFDNIFARLHTIDVTKPPYNINPSLSVDNTSVLVNLFATLPDNAVVYFPAGTYTTTATLFPSRPCIILGDGPHVTIFMATSVGIDVFSTANVDTGRCSFRDFSIDSPLTKVAGAGIVLTTALPSFTPQISHTVENVHIFRQYIGIQVANSVYCSLKNNYISESINTGIVLNCTNSASQGLNIVEGNTVISSAGLAGIWSVGSKNRIINNSILGHGIGILVAPDQSSVPVIRVLITGNDLQDQSNTSILIQTPVVGSTVTGFLIAHNFISGSLANLGIGISGGVSVGLVTNNVLQLGLNGHTSIGVFAPATSVSVSTNFIRSLLATCTGINGGGLTFVAVVNNVITGVNTPYTNISGTFISTQTTNVGGLPASAVDGSLAYTSDGLKNSDPLTAGSTGALAIRANGVWRGV